MLPKTNQQKEKDKLYFIKIKNWECSKNKTADVTVEIIAMFKGVI